MMRKKLWTILLTVFVFLAGSALGISAVYRVDSVTVNVNYITEEAKAAGEEITNRLEEAYQGASTLFVEQYEVEEILEDYPYFRITSFEKSYPKRIVIEITENAEVYAVEKTAGEAYYILNANGVVISIRQNPTNPLNGEENVLLKGLDLTLENGERSTDETFLTMLSTCQAFSEELSGIRCNVVSVALIRRTPEMVLAFTMREGVTLYISNPAQLTKEKVEVALTKYFDLSDAEKMCGRILFFENSGQIYSDYSSIDEFQQ